MEEAKREHVFSQCLMQTTMGEASSYLHARSHEGGQRAGTSRGAQSISEIL